MGSGNLLVAKDDPVTFALKLRSLIDELAVYLRQNAIVQHFVSEVRAHAAERIYQPIGKCAAHFAGFEFHFVCIFVSPAGGNQHITLWFK